MPVENFRSAIEKASSFNDILDVFSRLSGGVDYKKAFQDAERLKAAYGLFTSSADIEERYEASRALASSSNNDQVFRIAGFDRSAVNIVRYSSGPSLADLGKDLLERHVSNGETILRERAGISEEMEKEFQETCARIADLCFKHDEDNLAIFERFDAECERVGNEYGITDLRTQEGDLLDAFQRQISEHNKRMPDPNRDHEAYTEWFSELGRKRNDWEGKCQLISEKRRELSDKYIRPLKEKRNADLCKHENLFQKVLDPLKMAKAEFERKFGQSVLNAVLESSSISQEEADAWSERQFFEKSALSRLKKNGNYDEAGLKKDLSEFYRLTGGRLGSVVIQTEGSRRANASHGSGVINIDSRFTKKTFFHELAHLLEREPKILAAEIAFRDSRADMSKGLRKLRNITKNPGYKSDEVAYVGDYFDPYVGKVYPRNNSTEVMSMGLQMFSSPESIVDLRTKAPEMFNMMVGFMASKPSERELAEKAAFSDAREKVQDKQQSVAHFYDLLKKRAKGDDFWKGSGLIKSIHPLYSHRKTPKTELYYFYPGEPQGEGHGVHTFYFKNRQDALNFAYLYLLLNQKGWVTAGNAGSLSWDLFSSVTAKRLPDALKDMNDSETFLEDLKEAA